jgi:G:T-mismatch repair DNA endonuclease (very short patch repair protein)
MTRNKISKANEGRIQSNEEKRKRGISLKKAYNEGRKISFWKKGKSASPETEFKKGQIGWNKGTKGICKANSGSFYKNRKPTKEWKEWRKTFIMPIKDTKKEVKMQNLLKELKMEFLIHQYMHIEHGYQCDILIPVQEGINQKTIIECFGTYWHKYPRGREIDALRCQELRQQGWRVLVLWENEIKIMEANDLKNELRMEVLN